MEDNLFENLMTALDDYGQEVMDKYRLYLIRDDKRATGNLINNISVRIAYKGVDYTVYLQLEDYYRYVEEGRKAGKWPPVSKILEWIRIKPVLPRPDGNGKLPTNEQLAFLIARKIGTQGIPAGHQLREAVDEVNAKYLSKLQEALRKDFDTYAMKTFGDHLKLIKI